MRLRRHPYLVVVLERFGSCSKRLILLLPADLGPHHALPALARDGLNVLSIAIPALHRLLHQSLRL